MVKEGFINGLTVAPSKLAGILDIDESVSRSYQDESYAQEEIDRQRGILTAIVEL